MGRVVARPFRRTRTSINGKVGGRDEAPLLLLNEVEGPTRKVDRVGGRRTVSVISFRGVPS